MVSAGRGWGGYRKGAQTSRPHCRSCLGPPGVTRYERFNSGFPATEKLILRASSKGYRGCRLRADCPELPRLRARAISALSRIRIRSCGHAGAHAHTLRLVPRERWGLRGGAELSCLGYEVIPGGGACRNPPFEVPPPMRRGPDPGCLRFSVNGCRANSDPGARAHAPGAVVGDYGRTGLGELAGGRGDGRGGCGDAFFRDDLEQHNKQWLLQPGGLRLGARAVLHGAYLTGAQAASGPGGGRGLGWRAGNSRWDPAPSL